MNEMKATALNFLVCAAFVGGLMLSADSKAEHEGFVVCQFSNSDIGDDCFDNWDTVDGFLAREAVARALANALGTKCIPVPLRFGCELAWTDTFDVCKTETGPCYRYQYSSGSVLNVILGPFSTPDPGDNGQFGAPVWAPQRAPDKPVAIAEFLYCAGTSAGMAVTWFAAATGETPLEYEVEVFNGSTWLAFFDGGASCIEFTETGTVAQFRARAWNYRGASDWENFSAFNTCAIGGGGSL